jgi:hypothetical protein
LGESRRNKKQQFPHSPLFWSSLWWELYQKQGREGVIAAFSLLKVQPLPGNGEAWFRFLVKSGNLIAANELYGMNRIGKLPLNQKAHPVLYGNQFGNPFPKTPYML